MNEPTQNTNIVTAAALGGAVAIVTLWLFTNFVVADVVVPAEVAGAWGVICTFFCGLFVRPS